LAVDLSKARARRRAHFRLTGDQEASARRLTVARIFGVEM
jgi:hypothetical protein